MAPASSIPGAGLRVWGFGVLGFRVWDLEFRSFEHSWAWPALRLKPQSRALLGLRLGFRLTGPKPKKIKVETFRIDYFVRTPKVKKLSLQPIRLECFRMLGFLCALRLKGLLRFAAQVGSCNHQMGVSEN